MSKLDFFKMLILSKKDRIIQNEIKSIDNTCSCLFCCFPSKLMSLPGRWCHWGSGLKGLLKGTKQLTEWKGYGGKPTYWLPIITIFPGKTIVQKIEIIYRKKIY